MVKQLDIKTGFLGIDLDTVYDAESNKIDVYTSVNWTADNESEYNKKEQIIYDYRIVNDLFELVCWGDISGYDYWVIQQEETNYVSIDVYLKKGVDEYTQQEIQFIANEISKADDYFLNKLE
jgi:hypothetical protein